MHTFYTVEIPHTLPAQVIQWPDRDEALRCYRKDLRGKVYDKIETSAASLYMEANSRVTGTLDRGDGESDLQSEAPRCPSGDCTGDAYYGTEGMEASTCSKPDPEGLIRCDKCDGLWDITGQEVESVEDVRDAAEAAVFEAAGDDLSSFHTFETVGALLSWSNEYASDPRPGGCGGHQSATISVQVAQMVEDSVTEFFDEAASEDLAEEVMGYEGQDEEPEISTVEDAIDAIEAYTAGSVKGSKGFSAEEWSEWLTAALARYNAAQVFLRSLEGKEDSEDQERDIVHPRLALEVAQSTILDLQDLFKEHNIDLKDPDGNEWDISAYTDEALSMIQMALNEAAPEDLVEEAKTFVHASFGETLVFAESLGWVDEDLQHHGEDDVDATEENALDFIKSKGYVVTDAVVTDAVVEEAKKSLIDRQIAALTQPEDDRIAEIEAELSLKASPPPLKHSTPEDGLTMIHDPGHGWLVVPIADVEASGIEVSRHSYWTYEVETVYGAEDKRTRSGNYYLEQDKDVTAYLRACGYKFSPDGWLISGDPNVQHKYYKSIDFENGAVRCVEEN